MELKTNAPPEAVEPTFGEKQLQVYEPATSVSLSEGGELAQPPAVKEVSQADPPSTIDVSSGTGGATEMDKPFESSDRSDGEFPNVMPAGEASSSES